MFFTSFCYMQINTFFISGLDCLVVIARVLTTTAGPQLPEFRLSKPSFIQTVMVTVQLEYFVMGVRSIRVVQQSCIYINGFPSPKEIHLSEHYCE